MRGRLARWGGTLNRPLRSPGPRDEGNPRPSTCKGEGWPGEGMSSDQGPHPKALPIRECGLAPGLGLGPLWPASRGFFLTTQRCARLLGSGIGRSFMRPDCSQRDADFGAPGLGAGDTGAPRGLGGSAFLSLRQ